MSDKDKSDVDKTAVADDFDLANAQALLEMLADPVTPESVKLQIINDVLEGTKDNSFFQVMFEEGLDKAECRMCGHENHWLIPEDELNIFGHVTAEEDPRVKTHTTENDCKSFQEACQKKKVTA